MDSKRVIKGLEICINRIPGKYTCNECPYEIDGNYCEINLSKDALALLKEHEEDRIEIAHEMVSNSILMYQGNEIVRCKDCKNNNQCSIQFKFADADNPGNWFCADGERKEGQSGNDKAGNS